jgi:hypothetical protein
MYFTYFYGNRMMKPAVIVLNRVLGERERDGVVETN